MKTLAITMAALTAIVTCATAQVGLPSKDDLKAKNLEMLCSVPAGATDPTLLQAATACGSYMRGLTDGLFIGKAFTDAGKTGCLPQEAAVSVDEATRDFEAYLKAHPAAGENSAGLVVAFAIISKHQCGHPG